MTALRNIAMLSGCSHVRFFVTLWTVAHQAPLSMGFSRQEYWSELPCPPSGDHPDLEIESASPESPALQADSLSLSHQRSPIVDWMVSPQKRYDCIITPGTCKCELTGERVFADVSQLRILRYGSGWALNPMVNVLRR